MKETILLVYCTTSGIEESKRIAQTVIEKKLAACCNILPRAISIYNWQGETEEIEESLIMIKTTQKKYEQLEKEIKMIHNGGQVTGADLTHVVLLGIVFGDFSLHALSGFTDEAHVDRVVAGTGHVALADDDGFKTLVAKDATCSTTPGLLHTHFAPAGVVPTEVQDAVACVLSTMPCRYDGDILLILPVC